MRASFQAVAVRKPDASRDRSREVYLLGRGLKAETQARAMIEAGVELN
jgi:23S rRNA U2552 (ribose-2'-O)-methylase RlmE/FtsJ